MAETEPNPFRDGTGCPLCKAREGLQQAAAEPEEQR